MARAILDSIKVAEMYPVVNYNTFPIYRGKSSLLSLGSIKIFKV